MNGYLKDMGHFFCTWVIFFCTWCHFFCTWVIFFAHGVTFFAHGPFFLHTTVLSFEELKQIKGLKMFKRLKLFDNFRKRQSKVSQKILKVILDQLRMRIMNKY